MRQDGYESRDAPARGVAWAILGLLGGIGLSAAFVAGLLALLAPPSTELASRTGPGAGAQGGQRQPRLELPLEGDAAAVQAAARSRLEGYGWADRKAGQVRVPISRAMEMLAKQGWPDKPNDGALRR
jgi:hypothetical protein